jgi:hypothetical protein
MKHILYIFFLVSAFSLQAQKVTISGYIKDAKTGEELIGATVFVEETKSGGSANIYGFYSITLPKAGTYNIKYNYLGYSAVTKTLDLTQSKTLNVELSQDNLELKEVVVTGEQSNANVEKVEMSSVSLKMEAVKKIPAFFGEVDVLKIIQLLPGVQNAGDGNTGFFVRGGGSDQNLILLDEAIVYNASHLFNFFSVFNSDAIKDLKLSKGGITPEYGGRLSSVLDIRMKDGNTKEFKGTGGLGLISSRLTLEGPIIKDKSSFLVSGRRTYADLFLKLSPDEAQRSNKLYFYDFNTKFNYTINDKNRIFLSGYFGRDVLGFDEFFGFDWGNTTGTLRWNHLFSDKLFSNFSLIYTNYLFNIKGDIGPVTFRWKSAINDINLKSDFTYYLNSKNTFNFGVQSIYHQLDPGEIKTEIQNAFSSTTTLSKNNGLEHGLYFNNEQKVNSRLSFKYGARFSIYQVIGGQGGKQYEYDKSDPNEWLVKDTINLQSGAVYQNYFGFEPRASAKYTLDEFSSIKASYNRIYQYVQQAQSAQSVAPYDVWFSVSNNIKPQRVDQVALGYFRNFKDDLYEFSVEGYYKNIDNLYDIIDNGDVLGNEFLESQLRSGRGWSYGLEFLLQKQSGKFTGFIGYTISRTLRQIDEINDGRAYFAPYDRRHDLSLTSNYQINPRLSVAGSFVYATGRAITLPIGKYEYDGVLIPIYDDRNSNRLIDYHRMDLSLTIDPKEEKKNKRFVSSWNISVFNVYGRKNPISIGFAENIDRPGQPNTNMFYIPGPIPSVTWNFSF